MDASGNDELKSWIQVNDSLEEVKASFEKAIKGAKASIEKVECIALQLCNAENSKNMYVSDSDVEDNVHRYSTPSIRRAPAKDGKKPIENEHEDMTKMLMILVPKLFEKK